MLKNKDIIDKMTLEEKAKITVGKDYWNSKDFENLGIPSITMSDGPNGLRIQRENGDNLGVNESEISICFPTGATLANSWDKDLAYLYGKTLGEEAECENINIILGPAINIKRNPLCGRNFEYFSEDPYLTSIMGTEYVKGVQESNVGVCVKHFAVNNQENRRRTIDCLIDERNFREIYLKAFESIVKNAKPWSVMTSYNKINGEYASENKHLLEILQKEWGFDGITITDWGANNERVKGILAGNELEMPGGRGNGVNEIIDAVNNGEIKEELLDEIVDRIITIAKRCAEREIVKYDKEKHHEIACKIAEESVVLLRNKENILPINSKEDKDIVVIGDMAKNPRYQGAGSSTINLYRLDNAYDELEKEGFNIDYAKGYERIESENDKELLEEAIKLAKQEKPVLLFVGLTENYESEGMDRANIDMPNNQLKLIREVAKVNDNVIVVLSHGSSIAMPWRDDVKGIITGYLGGEAGGKAIVRCLTGKVNPSGKLAETYAYKLEDHASNNYFPGNEINVAYKESIFVGYRYFDTIGKNVLYPFGYGLSYTKFIYSNLDVHKENDKIIVEFQITNAGDVKGKEIAEIYVGKKTNRSFTEQESKDGPEFIMKNDLKIMRPKKELKGFAKVELEPGASDLVTIELDKSAFEFYDVDINDWNIENGEYEIIVGKSCEEIVLKEDIKIDGNEIKKQDISDKYLYGYVWDITDEEFEKLLGYKIPSGVLDLNNITDENTVEQLKNTKVGKEIVDSELERMNQLLAEQNTNKATKVMMDLQKPLKKFYEKKGKYTKEIVDEFIERAKKNKDAEGCEFVDIYLKRK